MTDTAKATGFRLLATNVPLAESKPYIFSDSLKANSFRTGTKHKATLSTDGLLVQPPGTPEPHLQEPTPCFCSLHTSKSSSPLMHLENETRMKTWLPASAAPPRRGHVGRESVDGRHSPLITTMCLPLTLLFKNTSLEILLTANKSLKPNTLNQRNQVCKVCKATL